MSMAFKSFWSQNAVLAFAPGFGTAVYNNRLCLCVYMVWFWAGCGKDMSYGWCWFQCCEWNASVCVLLGLLFIVYVFECLMYRHKMFICVCLLLYIYICVWHAYIYFYIIYMCLVYIFVYVFISIHLYLYPCSVCESVYIYLSVSSTYIYVYFCLGVEFMICNYFAPILARSTSL